MGYILEHEEEVKRLERQSLQKHYSLEDELQYLNLNSFSDILDAGCGSGLLSRYIQEKNNQLNIHACDFSDLRVHQAKKLCTNRSSRSINFFQADLLNLPLADQSLDLVISRYVFEYLPDPLSVTREFFRVLRPGGTVYLIDVDGIFLNYHTSNEILNRQLQQLATRLSIDLYVGRRLPALITQAGFEQSGWKMTAHPFQGEDLTEEKHNAQERIKMARPSLSKIFTEPDELDSFATAYIEEIDKPGSVLFHDKFIAWGKKP